MELSHSKYLDIESALLSAETLLQGLIAVSNDQLQCLLEEPKIHEFFIYRGNAIMQLLNDLKMELQTCDDLLHEHD